MTKFAKISLVAALAVTAASAVDFSGYATYRFDNGVKDSNAYKAAVTAKQDVSNDFKVTVGVSAGSSSANSATSGIDETSTGTKTLGIPTLSFTYSGVKDLTVIAGRQALNTPWTQGSSVIDGTQQGNGVLGLYNTSYATFAAGHFTTNNMTATNTDVVGNVSDADLNVVAAIVPLPMIGATAQAWFVDVGAGGIITKDTHAASYNLAGKVANVSYDARYSTLTLNDADAATLGKIVASTNVAGVDLTLGYGKTGKNGGGIVAFDQDGDASFGVEIANLNTHADTKATLVGAAYNVLPNVNASVNYLDINGVGALKDSSEIDAALTYTASKNMTAKVVYAQLSGHTKADDVDLTRVELAYKF